VRAQTISRLQRQTQSPNDIASKNWWETAFPGHAYGRPVIGSLRPVPRISTDDLKAYTRRVLARDSSRLPWSAISTSKRRPAH
jgi:zinc protease